MSQEASGSPRFAFATAENVKFLEDLYKRYKQDPASVDASWQRFFEGYDLAAKGDTLGAAGPVSAPASATGTGDHESSKVEAFINAYRRLGHLLADIEPITPF